MTAPPEARAEIRPLTGLRAFPALLVVFFHFYRWQIPRSVPVVHDLVEMGFVAVGMFFVLSGFILTYVYAGHDLREPAARRAFWISRVARIYPTYFLSLAIAFVARLPASARALTTPMGWARTGLVLTLLNAFSHYGMFHLNWAAWSLSAEAFFYLVFPFLAPRLARLHDGALAWVAAFAWLGGLVAPAAYSRLDPDHLGRALRLGDEVLWSWYLKFFPLTHLGCFVVGLVAGRLFVRHRAALARVSPGRRDFVAAASALFVVALLNAGLVPCEYLLTDALAPVFAVLVTALAAAGDGAPSFVSRAFAARPVVALGRASYAVYILHVPVFYAFLRFLPSMWDDARLFWPYLGALLAVSALAYRFVEEPARRWVRRALSRRGDSTDGTAQAQRGTPKGAACCAGSVGSPD